MTSIIAKLHTKGLIKPPPFVVGGSQYEVLMGSSAYGVSGDHSDSDVYAFCIPSKDLVFPHLAGEIHGFGTQHQRFGQFQQHHVDSDGTQYDLVSFNIIKYFQLCLDNNPNMIDSLFVPQRCIVFTTQIGQTVREARKKFLHRGAWHKFKGYAYSQMKKIRTDPNEKTSEKRKKSIEEFGYDVKFGYHVVRLMEEVRQVLVEGDLDLERNSEQLKSIRRGEWSLQQLQDWFATQESSLEAVYNGSKLPWGPQDGVEDAVKTVLLQCLEAHYGSLAGAVETLGVAEEKLARIRRIVEE